MNSDNFEYYRNEIFKFIQNEIVPKYPEIESCSMENYPNHLDWDVGFIFKQNIDNADLKNFKSRNVLEREIRSLLYNYCNKIDAADYYLFILPIFI